MELRGQSPMLDRTWRFAESRFGDASDRASAAFQVTARPHTEILTVPLNGEIFYTLAEAQILIEAWRRHYNTVRPHSSLGYRPPAPETATPPWLPSGSASLHLRPAMAPEAILH